MMQRITVLQDTEPFLRIVRAAHVVHRWAGIIDRVRWILALVATVAAFIALAFPVTAPYAALAALLYSIVGELIAQVLLHSFNRRAALLQQVFDTTLFEVPWGVDDQRPTDQEIVVLSGRYRGEEKEVRGWYVDVTGIPAPIAQVVCQRQNLLWDSQLRAAWTWLLTLIVAGYFALAVIVAVIADASVRDLVLWGFAPPLPLIIPTVANIVQNRVAIRDRRRAFVTVSAALEGASETSSRIGELRQVCIETQRAIFESRTLTPRVPNWYYQSHKDEYTQGFEVEAEGFRAQWAEGA